MAMVGGFRRERWPVWSSAVRWVIGATAVAVARADVYYVSPAGDDAGSGTELAPWRTIAHAAAMLEAGETVRILPGTYENERMAGTPECENATPECRLPGIKPQSSGAAGAPIVFEAWPVGAAVVIDQGGLNYGFVIAENRHFIELRGLEIRNARSAAVLASNNVSNLLIENCVIQGVSGEGDVGGLVLRDCRDSTIRGCDIRDIANTGTGPTAALLASNSANITVEFNRLHGGREGVFLQRAADPGRDWTIRANYIFDMTRGVLLSVGGVGQPPLEDVQIYGNVMYDIAESAIETDALSAADDSISLYVGNNTIIRVGNGIVLDRFRDVWITQNIIEPHPGDTEYGLALVTLFDPGLVSFFDIDWNFYGPFTRFELNRGSAAQQTFWSLWVWQAYGYDLNALAGDALFIDAAGGNYHLRRASACRNGGWFFFPSRFGETDIDGQPRYIDGLVDIGADEADLVLRPDTNCDGFLDFFDIDPFLLALLDPAGYATEFPMCPLAAADLNIDGAVNFFDIDPFVACLLGGPCP